MTAKRKGFTLLEILIALGMLALIYAMATARFHGLFAMSRLAASGQGIGDHFTYAVSRAYTTGTYHTLTFDLTGGRYWIELGREDTEATKILKRRLAGGVTITDIQIGYDRYTPPGSLSIEISPLGVTNDVIVNLQDENERAFAVSLNALIQRIEYFEERKEYEDLQDVPAI